MFQQVTRREISNLGAMYNGFSEQLDVFTFKIQVGLKQGRNIVPMPYGIDM
jgi:hypothetical protein